MEKADQSSDSIVGNSNTHRQKLYSPIPALSIIKPVPMNYKGMRPGKQSWGTKLRGNERNRIPGHGVIDH